MSLEWTPPKTDWANNNLVDAAAMNAIGKNLVFLKAPPTALVKLNESADFTTSSTSWTEIDGAGSQLQITLETAGGDVLIIFWGVFNSSGSAYAFLDVDIDGTRLSAWDSGPGDGLVYLAPGYPSIGFVTLARNLPAGTHTFKMMWRTSSASYPITMYVSGARKANSQFWVREVS